ncbi:isochorismatase family protein [Thalassobacillus sp. B23F22_16]|uniref:isochorismatase family protein n=1 Tax=Thalassobacillus sp. B23F22_16 TaxID=3459513 RepID=UPI00373F4332
MTRVRPWESLLSDTDKEVVQRGGYGKSRGLGKKPLVMVIDVQNNYVGEDQPILDQIGEWPSGGGEAGWRAIEKIDTLLDNAREDNIPILYTRNVQKNISFDSFSNKTDRDQTKYVDGHFGTQIVDRIAPKDGELVIDKAYASAFYATPLVSWLVKLGVDSLIIVGGSTSGCVRATAIDAVSRNFNVAVVEDCVYDRIELSHKASLFDLWMKYADVINLDESQSYLSELKN